MSNTVIKVESLGKKYLLRHQSSARYTSLRDVISNKFKSFSKAFKPQSQDCSSPNSSVEEFWALDDISFEISQGDRVGIIGRNGAGKSTLLKVLSRITEPTRGRVTINGRVASLLEVGTGFHPELTGRENIYLNGAILGMSRLEIKRKFEEIVDFAEVEKFLDTPVKRYSSGMYVRLAFAVAAHLEPEILIVDEVLAVGDAQFQKKCLGKLENVGKEGKTVLFVSHNMGAISALCNKGIMLSAGRITYNGGISEAVSLYNGNFLEDELSVANCARRGGSGGIRIKNVWVSNGENQKANTFTSFEKLSLNLEAEVDEQYQNAKNIVVGFGIDTLEGQRLFTSVSSWGDTEIKTGGRQLVIRCVIPSMPLVSDKYLISTSISTHGETLDYVEHCGYLEIIQSDMSCSKGRTREHGCLDLPYVFEVANV